MASKADKPPEHNRLA